MVGGPRSVWPPGRRKPARARRAKHSEPTTPGRRGRESTASAARSSFHIGSTTAGADGIGARPEAKPVGLARSTERWCISGNRDSIFRVVGNGVAGLAIRTSRGGMVRLLGMRRQLYHIIEPETGARRARSSWEKWRAFSVGMRHAPEVAVSFGDGGRKSPVEADRDNQIEIMLCAQCLSRGLPSPARQRRRFHRRCNSRAR